MNIHLLGYSESTISRILDSLLLKNYSKEVVIVKNITAEESIPFRPEGINCKTIMWDEWKFDDSLHQCMLGVTKPLVKEKVFEFFLKNFNIQKENYDSLAHPAAVIASTFEMNKACFIEPGTVIASFARMGFAAYLNRGSTIGHHTVIGDFATINPGVHIAGHCMIGSKTLIGMGTVVFDHIRIGSNAIIGGGSVVTKDIPDNVIAWGNPCKVIRSNDEK